MVDYSAVGAHLERVGVDGWLVYDFRGINPVFAHLVSTQLYLTRRAFLLFTRSEAPRMLVSRVDATDAPPSVAGLSVDSYTTWEGLHAWLERHVGPLRKVAMEYSPYGALPAMSWVDGGTLDIVRRLGVDVTSSAELFQLSAATWSDASLLAHLAAMENVVAIKDLAIDFVQRRVAADDPCSEFAVQSLILREFDHRGLVTDGPPIVSVNAHSGDPHYEPSEPSSADIGRGDWLLIDLWAKERSEDAVFADITWVAYVGPEVPSKHREIFDIVAGARDAVVRTLHDRDLTSEPIRGFELDRAAREVIASAGYGDAFVHRTGHSLGPGDSVHGLGANLDDLETHDTRTICEGSGFTVEPGIYLPEFGVRSEINVYVGPRGPTITSPVQAEPAAMEL